MKETIYTIPINEAFDTECNCPLCLIEEKVENEQTKYVLGPSMMEPEFRIKSNENGFCKTHYKKLLENHMALPTALILQTHAEYYNKKLFDNTNLTGSKKSLFKKNSDEFKYAQNIIKEINKLNNSCVICENVKSIMDRYVDNLIYIWKTQPDFKTKYSSKKGFCLPHFAIILDYASKNLSAKDFSDFFEISIKMQIESQNGIYQDISSFVNLFDYNSDKNPSPDVKNAINNTIQKYSGLSAEND